MKAQLGHLFRIRILEGYRNFQENILVYLLFAPIVFVIFFILIRRTLEDLSILTTFFSSQEFFSFWRIFSGLLFPLSTFYFLRWVMIRSFPVQNSDLLFLSLPVSKGFRFHSLIFELGVKNIPLALIYLLLTTFLFWEGEINWVLVLGFFPILSLGFSVGQIFLTHLMVRFGWLTFPRMVLILLFFGGLAWFWGKFTQGQEVHPFFILLLSVGLLVLTWFFSYSLFSNIKAVNLQRAEKFLHTERKRFFVVLGYALQWIPQRIRPYIVRDFILTFRRLSSSFLLYPLVVAGFLLAFASLLLTGWTAPYLPYWVCALSSFGLASMTVPLFRSTFPYLWMDAVHPVRPNDFYFGKIVFAILISLPIPILVIGMMFFLGPFYPLDGVDPHGFGLGYLLFRLLFLSVGISAIVSGFLFEGEQRPVLHKIITGIVSVLATALLAVHWGFILLLPVVIGYMKDLGLHRLKRIYEES